MSLFDAGSAAGVADGGGKGGGPHVVWSLEALEDLYNRYNRRQWVHPDPLEFLYHYQENLDREVVGIVASSLAYGRVAQILRSVSNVLKGLGPSPASFLRHATAESLRAMCSGFKHRFTTGEELYALLWGVKDILDRYGSLERCFAEAMTKGRGTSDCGTAQVLGGLKGLVEALNGGVRRNGMFLPSPEGGSACKRLNLFLRWMVRRDEIDPGGWQCISPSALIIPLDTHMHRISLRLGLTCRKQGDMRTALEVTEAFRSLVPEDPVRFDFALTRLGIIENMR